MNTTGRGSSIDLHSSGFHSFTNESTVAGGSSAHSSPENSLNYGSKYNQTMGNYTMDSPQQNYIDQSRRTSLNDSMMFNYDPRIVAGIRAMNMTPQQGEIRIPTPICKYRG